MKTIVELLINQEVQFVGCYLLFQGGQGIMYNARYNVTCQLHYIGTSTLQQLKQQLGENNLVIRYPFKKWFSPFNPQILFFEIYPEIRTKTCAHTHTQKCIVLYLNQKNKDKK